MYRQTRPLARKALHGGSAALCHDRQFHTKKNGNQHRPEEELRVQFVPEAHEGEREKRVKGTPQHPGAMTSAKWHVHVPHEPPVEGAMPVAPEASQGIVHTHASLHVFVDQYAVRHCPETKETPWYHELEPNKRESQINDREHLKTGGRERVGSKHYVFYLLGKRARD